MRIKTKIIAGFVLVILISQLLLAAALFALQQNRIQPLTIFLWVTGITVVTTAIVGLWIYRSISVPVFRLRQATQNIKEGNLDFKIDTEGNDEFAELSKDGLFQQALVAVTERIP